MLQSTCLTWLLQNLPGDNRIMQRRPWPINAFTFLRISLPLPSFMRSRTACSGTATEQKRGISKMKEVPSPPRHLSSLHLTPVNYTLGSCRLSNWNRAVLAKLYDWRWAHSPPQTYCECRMRTRGMCHHWQSCIWDTSERRNVCNKCTCGKSLFLMGRKILTPGVATVLHQAAQLWSNTVVYPMFGALKLELTHSGSQSRRSALNVCLRFLENPDDFR